MKGADVCEGDGIPRHKRRVKAIAIVRNGIDDDMPMCGPCLVSSGYVTIANLESEPVFRVVWRR